MMCSEIINKINFEKYLKNVLVNKRYLSVVMSFFNQIKNIQKHEKIMFLLYNEYISLEELAACADSDSLEFDESMLDNIISDHAYKWETPYAYIRDDFFRNYVTTLTFENYENIDNIKNQLAIVFSSLTLEEITFLKDNLDITKYNFIDLVRIQKNSNTIELAAIECDGNKLNKIASMISGTKDYRTNKTIANSKGSDYLSETIKTVLKKIDLGTIH